jgi:hypothetical protein
MTTNDHVDPPALAALALALEQRPARMGMLRTPLDPAPREQAASDARPMRMTMLRRPVE